MSLQTDCLINEPASESAMEPLVFEPYLRPVVWGGRKLGDVLGKSLPDAAAYGESWELSPHAQHVSRVAEGPLAGQSLEEIYRSRAADMLGTDPGKPKSFPLLIKFLDCRELLSIQVHPDDRLARELAGESFGKTEAWVVLQADPGARIYAGFQPGVTRRDVERHLAAGTLEQTLHAIAPQEGDCLYLPAGTVHAVGGGVLMAEVQQASDATFRLYDWNRVGVDGQPRELHIEQALASINWDAGPVSPRRPATADSAAHSEPLVAGPHFEMDRILLNAGSIQTGDSGCEIWLVLDGSAVLRTATGYSRGFQRGETALIPAATRSPQWSASGAATLLRVKAPATPSGES